jgi:hypothetical protein
MGMILPEGLSTWRVGAVSVRVQKYSTSLNAALAVVVPMRSTEPGITNPHNQDYVGPCFWEKPLMSGTPCQGKVISLPS